jgi:seryl-tRNA synthetase
VGRTLSALWSNHQREDGTVEIPAALVEYGAPVTLHA